MPVPFTDLGVDPAVAARLSSRGIDTAFPVQEAAIPPAIAGRDVVAKAPTGSGKTIAFGVAAVARCVDARPRRPRGLILEPTRELAAQVRDELGAMKDDSRRVIAVYGGTRYGPTQAALSKGVDLLVACPGRLEDLIEQRMVDLSDVELVVVDEADRMADMGFLPVVRRLIEQTAEQRQVLLFSATMGKEVESLVSRYQRDPARVDVTGDDEAQGDVDHLFWAVPRDQRLEQCATSVTQLGRAIVFCRTRRGADRVARQLTAAGVSAVAIHGDRTQAQRERALKTFEEGRALALVATDVAARGIHLDALPGVIHFDPPAEATDYTHRSGRTGRAGLDGVVISMVVEDQRSAVTKLQRGLGLPTGFTDPTFLEAPVLVATAPAPARSAPAIDEERPSAPRRQERAPRRGSGPVGPTSRHRAERGTKGPSGTVKFFNAEKGYGFVSREGDSDLFVHASSLVDSPSSQLEVGQKVAFEIGSGKRGAEARNVRVLSGTRGSTRRQNHR